MTGAALESLVAKAARVRAAIDQLTILAREEEQLRQAFARAEAEARACHDEWRSAAAQLEHMQALQACLANNANATLTVIKTLMADEYDVRI